MTAIGRSTLLAPLTPLEVAAGTCLEPLGKRVPSWPQSGPGPRAALEAELLAAMADGPVSVSFSGGRDSSLILAVACLVARREGLPDPVPVTMTHDSAEAGETEWQRLVLGHLGLADQVVVDVGSRMDVLGVEARALLEITGVQSPPNAYLHLAMAEAAPTGTLVTGAGGDEVLASRGSRLAQVRWCGLRARPRDVMTSVLAAAPRVARRRYRARDAELPAFWLRPDARREVARRVADSRAAVRVRWDAEAAQFVESRATRLGVEVLKCVGARHGVRILSPMLDGVFVHAMARAVGPGGPPGRSATMQSLAGDLLPQAVIQRETKASFGGVVWGPEFRRFVEGFDPDRLDPAVRAHIDVDVLSAEWRNESPHYATMMLAQQAWLDSGRADRVDE